MKQLKMIRRVHGKYEMKLPEGYTIQTFKPGMERDWIESCYELNGNRYWSKEEFDSNMLGDKNVAPERIFFAVNPEGKGVATAIAATREEENVCWLHMVGTVSDPAIRGKGLGYSACAAAVNCMEDLGADRDYLWTDDFRIPAIKIYLKLGFQPVLYNDDPDMPSMASRWAKIAGVLGRDEIVCYDDVSACEVVLKAIKA